MKHTPNETPNPAPAEGDREDGRRNPNTDEASSTPNEKSSATPPEGSAEASAEQAYTPPRDQDSQERTQGERHVPRRTTL